MSARYLHPAAARWGMPLWLVSILTLASVTAWLGWNAYADYQQAIEHEYRLLDQGARHRARVIAGTLRSTELVLEQIEEDLNEGRYAPGVKLSALLTQRMRQLPEVSALVVVAADGRVIGAPDPETIGFDAAQRDYFVAHQASADTPHAERHSLFVSAPYITATRARCIAVSRALHDASGQFSGVALATLDPEALRHILSSTFFINQHESFLLHAQGEIVAATPHQELEGRNVLGGPAVSAHIASGQQTTRHLNITQQTRRYMASVFHSIEGTPLFVANAREHAAIVADWRQQLLAHGIGFGIVAVFLLFLTWVAARRQTALIETATTLEELNETLQKQKEQIQSIAFIDGLTQIANRRRFDEVIVKEWNRNRREQSPLTLIMVDIDHFKRYNDHYGHLQGDECLRQVAASLQSHLNRASDLVARYGGEEFACIMSNTDLAGGQAKAEELRLAVASAAIPHAASPVAAHVTVSLGVATLIPDGARTPDDLLQMADEQLYKAKETGRNRVQPAALKTPA